MPGWPAGYPSRGAWDFRDMTGAFDFWPTLESMSITQLHPDGIMSLSCTVVDAAETLDFDDDDEVRVRFDGVRIWAGMIRATERSQASEHGPRTWDLTGQDYTAKLDDSVIGIAQERPKESIDDRVDWILGYLNYAITTTAVSLPAEQVEAAAYEGMTVREALQQVSDEKALHFYVDFDKDLHMFRAETIAAPFDLDDDTPNYTTRFPYSEFTYTRDTIELTNAVRVKGARHKRWVLDSTSIATWGRQESIIVDDSLRTVEQVIAAGTRRLNQLSEPIVEGTLVCWEPGLQAGQTLDLVNAFTGLDRTCILTEVEITAVDPHDDDGKALLRSAVHYTDRRRVGRFPGSGKDRKQQNRTDTGGGGGGTSTTGGDVGTCCNPIGTGEEVLTEATMGSSIGTPGFSFEPGDKLLLFKGVVSPSGDTRTGALVTNPTMSFFSSASSGRRDTYIYHRTIDGTEPTNFTIATAPGEEPDAEDWIWHLIKGPIIDTNFDTKSAIGAASSITPDNTALGYSDQSILVNRVTMHESIDDEGYVSDATEPPGSSLVGARRINGGGAKGEMWMAVSHGPTQSTDPATFGAWTFAQPNGATAMGLAFRVGSPYTGPGYDVPVTQSSPVTITIVPGPSWDGGNEGVNESTDQVGLQVDEGDIVLTSSTAGKDFVLRWTGPPDMPTQLDDWTITLPFTLDVAGDTGDPGERYVGLIATIDGQRFAAYARLGDGVRAQGALIVGDAETFTAKDITEGAQSYLAVNFSAGAASAKVWSGAEPSAWDVTTSVLEDVAGEEDSLVIDVQLGNDGTPVQTLVISPLLISGGALPGDNVDWHVVGIGDGTTVTFDTPYAYDELSLQVRVDGQVLAGSGIPDMDGAGASFTLSRAPYGDPSDATGSSFVEARYTRV